MQSASIVLLLLTTPVSPNEPRRRKGKRRRQYQNRRSCASPGLACRCVAVAELAESLRRVGKWRRYSGNRMYGARAAFSSPCFRWSRNIPPLVLQLEDSSHAMGSNSFGHDLAVPWQFSLNRQRSWPVRFFNPSVVTAPKGLCSRCAYVMTLRADCHHQCDASSPYEERNGGRNMRTFRGTVLSVSESRTRAPWPLKEPCYSSSVVAALCSTPNCIA